VADSSLPTRRSSALIRLLLGALAVVVVWQAIDTYRQWRTRFDELVAIAESTGVAHRRPSLVASMRRDAGPTRATLRLARALLADELDQRWIQDLPAAERAAETERGLERLDIAYRLGIEGLAERPESWEALLVIGGAEYLRMARRRDPRLLQDRELWLAPLEQAHRLAPVQPEPLRFLAATDLGNWSVLSAEERTAATERLGRAFADPTTFDLLSPAWLRVAPSLSQALAIVPDTLGAWSSLTRYFARRGDWERFCDAQDRADRAFRDFSKARMAEAAQRLRGGDRRKGTMRLLWVGSNAQPDAANLELIQGVLALAPPGFGGESSQPWLRAWFDWAKDRCLSSEACPLSGESLLRLASLNREVSLADRAWALAAAGQLRQAEALEREHRKVHGGGLDSEWTPYVLTKAGLLIERHESRDAMRSLQEIPLVSRDTLAYWTRYRSIAQASGDALEAARADAWLDAKARERWSPADWTVARYTAGLDIWPSRPAAGIRLRIRGARNHTGVLTLHWDGSLVDRLPAIDGRVIELPVAVTLGRHRLEIRAEQGAHGATAEVQLLAPAR
jgi:hypothetical protein